MYLLTEKHHTGTELRKNPTGQSCLQQPSSRPSFDYKIMP